MRPMLKGQTVLNIFGTSDYPMFFFNLPYSRNYLVVVCLLNFPLRSLSFFTIIFRFQTLKYVYRLQRLISYINLINKWCLFMCFAFTWMSSYSFNIIKRQKWYEQLSFIPLFLDVMKKTNKTNSLHNKPAITRLPFIIFTLTFIQTSSISKGRTTIMNNVNRKRNFTIILK